MRDYDSYLNDDDEQRDIQRFLTIVDQLHKPDGKNTYHWTWSIRNYIEGLLRHCSAGAESKEGSSRDNFPEAPDQLLPLIGKIAAEIAWNTINDIGLHNTIIVVLNTLQQYSWRTKVTLIVASYILTYGDNGLNLCWESKLMVDHPSRDFLRHSISVCYTFDNIEFFPVSAIVESNTDPSMVENYEKQMIVAAYSVIRVIVFAASSQLITRSSREDKLGSFSTTWCSNKLNLILEQLQPILDQMWKHYHKPEVVEHEDDHHLNISILLPTSYTAEDIDVYVEGDDLVVKTHIFWLDRKFPVGKKKYEKEHIKAVFDQNKTVLHVTVPKIIDPDFLQINVVTPS